MPAPAPAGRREFALVAPASGTFPFTVGFAFKQGDVPAGSGVAITGATVQVTPKNTWPDGSLKFAVIAGMADLTAGVPKTVALAAGASSNGTALTLADLKATGVSASVTAGAFGSATWAQNSADWDAPFQTWISGHRMSSWVYRKAIGTDSHLVAWLEVRLYAGGAVEVLPWVENGYLNVANPTSKSATYAFTLGGTQRFSGAIDLPAQCRTPLLSGAALAHWLAADPGVAAMHDAAYLQATELVPTYSASVPTNAAAVTGLPATFSPLQRGAYPSGMGNAGYSSHIGLLPEWDVVYLTSLAPGVWAALQRQGYSAGRYGIHYRDEATNRPLRFSQYPNLVLSNSGVQTIDANGSSSKNQYTPPVSGTAPPQWFVSHHPSVGYLAYLCTGRWFHMETVQFAATANMIHSTDNVREYGSGVIQTWSANLTRGAGWSVRTLGQAVTVTPDADSTLRTEFINSFAANIASNHNVYVASVNNPWGWMQPYADYTGVGDGAWFEAAWMQDFYTAALGYTKAMNLPLDVTTKSKHDEFFAWKAKSIVSRFGGIGATEYLYRDAAVYTIAISPFDTPVMAGDGLRWSGAGNGWYSDFGAVWTKTMTVHGPRTKAIEDGSLRGTIEATAYWGNLQPALAYAVRFGIAGASAGRARMLSAPNWSVIATGFNTAPVWSVIPAATP